MNQSMRMELSPPENTIEDEGAIYVNENQNSTSHRASEAPKRSPELNAVPRFSKGAWSIGRVKRQRSAAHVWVKLRSGEIVADVRSFPPWATNTNQGSETTEANARLIAAAPDLYAACKFALTTPGMIKGRDEMIAALKLANGQRDE